MRGLLVVLLCAVSACCVQAGDWETFQGSDGKEIKYAFVKKAATFSEASFGCQQWDSKLATPKNEEQSRFITDHARMYGEEWWTGYFLSKEDSTHGRREFQDQMMESLTYTNWLQGEPNNWWGSDVLDHEDCVSLRTAGMGGWNDLRCSEELYFVCEKVEESDPRKARYNFTYFETAARGEPARLLFAMAGVDFLDNRVKGEQWPDMKYRTIWGVLPQITITSEEGKVETYCQSNTINRLLARRFDLLGDSPKDEAFIDMIAGCMKDVMEPLFGIFLSEGTDQYEVNRNKTRPSIPWWLGQTQKFLEMNDGGDGWFVGHKPTLADAIVYHSMVLVETAFPGEPTVDSFPKLKALMGRFERIPGVAEWLMKRPDTAWK